VARRSVAAIAGQCVYAAGVASPTMAEFGPDAREFLQSHIDDHGFLSWLGVTVDAVDPGHIVMRVPYSDELTNPRLSGVENGRTVHGGVAATLIDTAGGLCVRSDLPDPIESGVATIDLNVSYLRPATSGIVATADAIRVGRTVGVAEVTVKSTTDAGEQDEVAVGRGSYRVFRDPER
jgi:uncharacterized protein (TIGR00369 family)